MNVWSLKVLRVTTTYIKSCDTILDHNKTAKLERKVTMRTVWGKQKTEGKVGI
jgi:hypothetical protein